MGSKFDSKMELTVYQFHHSSTSKIVSLIRELEQQLGKEKTHEIVSNWAEQNSVADVSNVVDSLKKSVESFDDVKVLLRQWVKELDETNIETVEITKETESESVCTVTECIYAKVFNDLDAADLGYLLYCKHDFAAAPAIHPKVALNRSKTVMEGDDCCDFEYYWRK